MLLPKAYQSLKIFSSSIQNMPHIRLTSVARPGSVRSLRQGDVPILSKIHDDLHLRVKAMNMPRLMIHRVSHEANTIEPDRSHLFLS